MVRASTTGRRLSRKADGTVNLIGSGPDKAHEGRSHEGLCPSGHAGDRGPGLKGLGPGGSVLGSRAVIAAEVEEIVDPVMGGEEALGLAGQPRTGRPPWCTGGKADTLHLGRPRRPARSAGRARLRPWG